MNDQTDQQLLRDYAERQSEAAFAAIVHRYVDLVYSAALRLSCDAHAAKDVTQSVFVALAQNAQQLTDRPALAGWLHSTARNLAAKVVRSEVRRRAREQEAAVMNELLSANPDTSWEHIAPHLDDALGELSEPDRDAVLLRYFKNHDLLTVGATLGISDDAAQKRVSRAVERLREFFAKRGVTVGASGLAIVISANAVQASPVGLALTISTAAALTGTTITATATATKVIGMTTLQKTLVTATVAVLAGAGIYEARQASNARTEAAVLRQQQIPLNEQVQQLTNERNTALAAVTGKSEELERLRKGQEELLRLRGLVGVLHAEKGQLETLNRQLQAGLGSNQYTAVETNAALVSTDTNNLPVQTFTANVRANVPWNQAVVTGGWKLPSGNRAALVVKVEPKSKNRKQHEYFAEGSWSPSFLIEPWYLEFSEAAAGRLGLDRMNTNDRELQSSMVLSADQYNALLTAADNSEGGVWMLKHGKTQAISGNHWGIPFKSVDIIQSGTAYSAVPYVKMVRPTISSDGQSVDMNFVATLKYSPLVIR